MIGLSRSFWLGIAVALAPLVFLSVKLIRPSWKKFFSAGGFSAAAGGLGALLLVLIVLFPLPYRVGQANELSALFSSRASDMSDVAVSSRWKLLPELWKEITVNPLLGSGFGEEVTFQTDDPRVRAFSPDGTWTTYSLEWGWLELWFKMGILGPLAFLWLFFGLLKGLWSDKSRPAWLTVGLTAGLSMLYVTHFFSPYLNHPLGLGFILFIVPFLSDHTPLQTLHITSPVGLPAVLREKSTGCPTALISKS